MRLGTRLILTPTTLFLSHGRVYNIDEYNDCDFVYGNYGHQQTLQTVTENWKNASLVISRGWVVDWKLLNRDFGHRQGTGRVTEKC